MPIVAGVDSSTQSTKVQLRDVDTGALLGEGRAPHPSTTPPHSEQDPEAWWQALVGAMHEACAQAGTDRVEAISVAGQQHGLVMVDEQGEVILPAKLWNDTESAPQAAALVQRIGAQAWAEATGSVPVASFTVTKVAWTAEHHPDALARAAHLLLPHDWLTYRLTGRFVTDRGDASGTGYWSPSEGVWRADLLAAADGRRSAEQWLEALPEVLGPDDAAGVLTDDAAHALGLRAGAVVAAGTGDNMAGALGLGLRSGDVAISIGTSGTVYAVSDRPTADASGAVAGFADATGRFLPLVCTLNGTGVTDAVARLLGLDVTELDALALTSPIGAGGVTLLPYLAGERTPDRPDATGTLAGLRTDARREDLARAAFEGLVCGLLDGLDALHTQGVATDGRLSLVGGGSRSPAFGLVLAELAGRELRVPTDAEQVALGACVQAAMALGRGEPDDILDSWGLDAAHDTIAASDDGNGESRAEVRERYGALRDRMA